ncbi:hypothetical protein [Zavarzinia sp.]|uniref:hypothetical protein n=1 Tax=Zavarzinia sp. TaxID=2027920 RepID=UPI003BB5A2B3|nr:hypothetical protein [Zavarzinia sp.]
MTSRTESRGERRALIATVERFLIDGLDAGDPAAAGGFAPRALLLDATGGTVAVPPEAWIRAFRDVHHHSCHGDFSHVVDTKAAAVCSQFTRVSVRGGTVMRQECAGHFRFRDGLIVGAVIHASRPVEVV